MQVSSNNLTGRLPPFETLPHPSCSQAVDVVRSGQVTSTLETHTCVIRAACHPACLSARLLTLDDHWPGSCCVGGPRRPLLQMQNRSFLKSDEHWKGTLAGLQPATVAAYHRLCSCLQLMHACNVAMSLGWTRCGLTLTHCACLSAGQCLHARQQLGPAQPGAAHPEHCRPPAPTQQRLPVAGWRCQVGVGSQGHARAMHNE